MSETGNAMSTATALMAERRKFEGWLAALDARRAATPEHVFDRVRADYERRLAGVVTELTTHADALDARVGELAERDERLEADARTVRDERCEAELRAHVGELSAEAWEAAAREADERLGVLLDEQRGVREELQAIRELLDAARAPAAPEPGGREDSAADERAAPSVPSLSVTAGAGSSTPDSGEDAGTAARPDPVPSPEAEPETGAGGDTAILSEPAPPEAPDDGAAPQLSARSGFDELAFLRNVTGVTPGKPLGLVDPPAAPRASGERPVDDSLGLVLPDETPAYTPPRRPSTETPMGANVTGSVPIVIKGEGKPGKTLKCGDCGSLNYPTEWYCERCGAELAAL